MKWMHRFFLSGLMLLGFGAASQAASSARVTGLDLKGTIDGENVTFSLEMVVHTESRNTQVALVEGDVAYLNGSWPRNSKLNRQGNRLILEIPSRGKHKVEFEFASLPGKDGDWRATQFAIPSSNVRKVIMQCDRSDLDIQFPGAMRIDEDVSDDGRKSVTAFLGASDSFHVRWKPEVKQLDAELVVACDANTIATATVGALHSDTMYTYRIVQGALASLSLEVPNDVNVTQVSGPNILEWTIDKSADGARQLRVELNRPQELRYTLRVVSELVLPEFPAEFSLPILSPRNVIRTSGFILTGTESAIKLLVRQAKGLIQIDHDAFPQQATPEGENRPVPNRTAYAYQYANLPFTLQLEADDVVTAIHVQDRFVVTLDNRDLALLTAAEIDIRDAAAREITFLTRTGWTVADVSGEQVLDYDIRDEGPDRFITVFFREGILRRTLVNLRLERSLGKDETEFVVPRIGVQDARSERGFLVIRGEYGTRLQPVLAEKLREVQPGSLPIRVAEAQKAYRFKVSDWNLRLAIEATPPTIYAELFHLASLGEGVLYGSCSITYHIEGAPMSELTLRIPEAYERVEFVGRDIRNWTQEGELWTLFTQERISGDYTLLVTYDQQFNEDSDEIVVGGITTEGAEGENGYVVVASSSSLGVRDELALDPGVLPIETAEVPTAYQLLINDPIIRGYKYVRTPHTARLAVMRYPTQQLLSQVTDHATLSTSISEEGELVTRATYYVKNASEQYLGIMLPAEARLWSAKVDDRNVQVLNTSSLEEVLVPVHRHDDPNRPVKVEVVYAESWGKLGLSSSFQLHAPASDAQSVFASWALNPPEGYVLGNRGGNMTSDASQVVTGLGAWLERTYAAVNALLDDGALLFLSGLLLLVVLCAIAYCAGHGRGSEWAAVAALVVFCGAVALGAAGARNGFGEFFNSVMLSGQEDVVAASTFTRVVSLAESAPVLDVRVVPDWIGSSGSLIWMFVGIGAGTFFIILGAAGRRIGPWFVSAGCVLAVVGLSQTIVTLQLLTWGTLIAVPLCMVVVAAKRSFRLGRSMADRRAEEPEPPPFAAPDLTPTEGADGFVQVRMLLTFVMLAGAANLIAASEPQVKPATSVQAAEVPDRNTITVDRIQLTIDAPAGSRDETNVARIEALLEFDTTKTGRICLLSPAYTLTEYKLSSERLELVHDAEGYYVEVSRAGNYEVRLEYLAHVAEEHGVSTLQLFLPECLRNQVKIQIPAGDLEVESDDTVLLRTTETAGESVTDAVFRPTRQVELSWHPRVRRTQLEEAVVFCEMNSVATFDAGVVHLVHQIRYQVARGEIQTLNLEIPPEMSVTAVRAEGLGTWRYDPTTKQMEAILEKPASGEFLLTVVTQVSQEGLPYDVAVQLPRVMDAARQRGALALLVPENVSIEAEELRGLSLMNVADFSPEAVEASRKGGRMDRGTSVKRAYRYHQLPVRAVVNAEPVLPEIRVTEKASVDISDERVVLSTQLDVLIAKAGLFSIRLGIPDDYEVESLTGEDVSHWDELPGDAHRLEVHFKKQILGNRQLQLVLARREKGIERTVLLPKTSIRDVMKHTGTIVVSGEPGVRFTTTEREGVSEINPRELGIDREGYLAFRLLRPGWVVELQTDVLRPVVRAEILQQAELSEGLIQVRAMIRYNISNAGIKRFQVRAPQPGIALTFVGANIAQFSESDPESGTWTIDLQNKVRDRFALEVRCQIPLAHDSKEVEILPLQLPDVHAQTGFLTVHSSSRLQVTPTEASAGLHVEDSRNIPREFGAGDAADAILCYRTARSDYALRVSVMRHDAADVLPATVQAVRMVSVVSGDDQLVTRVNLQLIVGNLRFLETTLPPDSRIWSVFVNGKPVTPLLQDEKLLIPLELVTSSEPATVEFIYGGQAESRSLGRAHGYVGPRFNLPLNDIEWKFYLPPRFQYYGFDGTLKRREDPGAFARVARFNLGRYVEAAQADQERSLAHAELELQKGEMFAKEGKQMEAKKAFESAMHNSIGAEEFNEDARIQYRNLARQQAVVGLVNRRDQLKRSNNLQDNNVEAQLRGFRGGNWTQEYGQQVQQSLEKDDNASLNTQAERILDQQAAAAGVMPAIRITLPQHGRQLEFVRALQINPNTEMRVTFKRSDFNPQGWSASAVAALVLLFLFRFAASRMPGVKMKPA